MARQSRNALRALIKEEISRLTEGRLAPEETPDDLPLFDTGDDETDHLGLDSLDALELAMTLEERYGIAVPKDVDFKTLATVDDLVAFVLRLVDAGTDDTV